MPKNKIKDSVCTVQPSNPDLLVEDNRDIKNIRITLCGYKNVIPTYSVSDLTVQAIHSNCDLGLSTKTTVTDDVYYTTNFDFVLQCDVNSSHSIDAIISHPVTLKLFEQPGKTDSILLVEKCIKPLQPMYQEKTVTSAESATDLQEAFTEKPVDKNVLLPLKKKSKKDVTKQSSKLPVSSSKSLKEKSSYVELSNEPLLIGTANLDLVPLFMGNKRFTENLLIYKTEKMYDNQMVPINIMPRLIVEVGIDESIWLSTDGANIVNLTIESIYHIPSMLNSNMSYNVSTFLPSPHGKSDHVIISGGKWTEIENLSRMKQWPQTSFTHFQIDDKINWDTKYRIEDYSSEIKNQLEINLEEILNSKYPKIEFNVIKRNYLTKQANREFHRILKRYRHIPLEIYISDYETEKTSPSPKQGENNFHFMAEVNVSMLLYPGVKKLRTVCPVSSFQAKEIQKVSGLPNSIFLLKTTHTPQLSPPPGKNKDDKGKAMSKGAQSPNKSVFRIPAVEEEDPIVPIYDQQNRRTFLLLEIELLVPLEEKRSIEDLTQNLAELLPRRSNVSKHIISEHLSEKYYTAVIKRLLEDLLQQHNSYIKNIVSCPCTEFGVVDLPNTFITFLRKCGIYETYITTMARALTTIVSEKKPYVNDYNLNSKEYQDFISTTYTDLIKQTNSLINEICNTGVEVKPVAKSVDNCEALLLYAKEANELGATLLADRYYLERICQSKNSEAYWFDYALFQLEIGNKEKALECLKQSLLINNTYKYSLMLFGILLSEKKRNQEAETCFLSAIFSHPKWLEGWGIMYLFYNSTSNIEGADLCQQMAYKCIKCYKNHDDYFYNFDDLTWSTEFCPDTIFFRTAKILIKMRAFDYAVRALVHAKKSNQGLYHYYLAVVMYYYRDYEHCLIHLEEAENKRGLDYAIGSLKGHAFLAAENLTRAKEEYFRVLEMFNRPIDVHLIYIYLALICERLDNKQQSRKLLLLACKYSPTPYVWLATGLLYYGQRDLISAEQCLLQANLCDNRLGEVWGYLVIINLELGFYNEAEMCYKQTKKNAIKNTELLEEIEKARKRLKN